MNKRTQRVAMKVARITEIAAKANKLALDISPLFAASFVASAFATEAHVPGKVLRADKPEIDKRRARRFQRRHRYAGEKLVISANV